MPVTGQGKDVVDVPEGVTATVEGRMVTIKGPKITVSREFPVSRISMALKGNQIVLTCDLPKKK